MKLYYIKNMIKETICGKGMSKECEKCDTHNITTAFYEAHRKELKLFEELTPQGSEFYDEPERVRDYIKEQLDLGHEARREVARLRRETYENY